MLVVLLAVRKGNREFEVFRSRLLTNIDKMFEPVFTEVEGKCVSVQIKEVIPDPDMRFGQAEHFVLTVYDECPGGDHHHGAKADDVFNTAA